MKRLSLFLCGVLLACGADLSGGNAYAQQSNRYIQKAHPPAIVSAPFYLGQQAATVRSPAVGKTADPNSLLGGESKARRFFQLVGGYTLSKPAAAVGPRAGAPASYR